MSGVLIFISVTLNLILFVAILAIAVNVSRMRKALVGGDDRTPGTGLERDCPMCIQRISSRATICPWCQSQISPAIQFGGSYWLRTPYGTWLTHQGRWQQRPAGWPTPDDPNPAAVPPAGSSSS